MQIDRHIERFGALQDRPEERVVEIAAAMVAVDDRALEAVADRAFQFVGGLPGAAIGNGQGRQSASDAFSPPRRGNRSLRARSRSASASSNCSTPGIERQHLHIDAGGVHLGHAPVADIAKLFEELGAAAAGLGMGFEFPPRTLKIPGTQSVLQG